MLVHGTTVDLAGLGIIILGASGAGKSDLALRLIDSGALLVSDDQSFLSVRGHSVWACAPERISGLLEVRGQGIMACATKAATCLYLAVELVQDAPARMPDASFWSPGDAGWPRLPLVRLDAREASAVAKVRITLAASGKSGRLTDS